MLQLMKPQDVADLLNVSIRTVWKLIATGTLPAENVTPDSGRPTYRVSRDALDGFLKRSATVPESVQRRHRRIAETRVIQFMK